MSSSCSSTANNLWQSRRMNNESPLMVRPSSVATSYVKGSSSTDEPPKVAPPRRAIAGKSVAELQQQHQKLMQQQQQQPVPYPRSILRKTGSVRSNSDNSLLSCSTASSTTTTDTASRAPSPLRMQQYEDDEPVNTTSQEFKVAREGWLYRKNSLMQWKPVYAVAKHGNAIKPGGLYLYKDDKFSSHIQTFDMSQVVEVEPRAQEYKAGIKWEFRMLVKREDVILATDDIASRKAWIDALTSIMGKVSMASHTELQSRITAADQRNRDLASTLESVQLENHALHHQLQDLEKSQDSLEAQCEILERELALWRAKAAQLEAQREEDEATIEKLQCQRDHDQARIRELENELKAQKEYRTTEEQERSVPTSSATSLDVSETVRDVKHSLRALSEQLRSSTESQPLVQNYIVDIKNGVQKLSESLEAARKGWEDLQTDIVRFLETESEERSQKPVSDQLSSLRRGLLGDEDDGVPVAEKLGMIMRLLQEQDAKPESLMGKSSTGDLVEKLTEWLEQKLAATTRESTNEIKAAQEEHVKVLVQLLENVIERMEANRVPREVAGLAQVVERLAETEQKLSQLRTSNTKDVREASEDHADEVRELVESTRVFMERTLRVLDRFGGSHTGMEDTVRRAVKSAFNSQMQDNKKDDEEKKLKRYEENAREYIDKSMSGMREHLEEYTGVMYRMIEDLVLRAVEHLEQKAFAHGGGRSSSQEEEEEKQLKKQTSYLIELHSQLSSAKQVLEADIERLHNEKSELEKQVSGLRNSRREMESEIEERKLDLQAIKVEYDTVKRVQQEKAAAALAKELEPLVSQIAKLKRFADDSLSPSCSSSSSSYIDLGRGGAQVVEPPQSLYEARYSSQQDNPSSKESDKRASFGASLENSWLSKSRPARAPSPLNGLLGRRKDTNYS